MTSLTRIVENRRLGAGLMAAALLGLMISAQAGDVRTTGDSFNLTGGLPGDQAQPNLNMGDSGGYLVFQDNATDGDGWGVRAIRLDANSNPLFGAFRVNQQGAGDQENARVVLLQNGGAAIVWQGGVRGEQDIFIRFLDSQGQFTSDEIRVNQFTGSQQETPAIAELADGSLLAVWASLGQDGDGSGIFARRVGASGTFLADEFQINVQTDFNQRSPEIAVLADGTVAVAYVTEQFGQIVNRRATDGTTTVSSGAIQFDIPIIARRLSPDAGEFLSGPLNLSGPGHYAHPDLTALKGGGAAAVWSRLSRASSEESWDVEVRRFHTNFSPSGEAYRLNQHTYGDQYRPYIESFGDQVFALWTSLGQDGWLEGVYGRSIDLNGAPVDDEFRLNTRAKGSQKMPALASNGQENGLAVWMDYSAAASSFEIQGQRLLNEFQRLFAPESPFVSGLSSSQISVTWPEAQGLPVSHYELFIDGAEQPVLVESNRYVHGALPPDSEHSYRLAYRLDDGRLSDISAAAAGRSWGADNNFDGLPDNWQSIYWPEAGAFPGALEDSDQDGASNVREFLAGTDPADPESVLKTALKSNAQGWRLEWNTEPGNLYQPQVSEDVENWADLGGPRLAAEGRDFIPVDAGALTGYFRVIRIR